MSRSDRLEAIGWMMDRLLTMERGYRLSRLVQDVQAACLFNEVPPISRGPDALQRLIDSKKADIEDLAREWENFFHEGKRFVGSYSSEEFLRAYLAYYSTVNVIKLQLMLNDLLRRGTLRPGPGRFHVVDLGTGPGTTFLAVADWLLAYRSLAGTRDFPASVRLTGIDRSREALRAARHASKRISETVTRWLDRHSQPASSAADVTGHAWRSVAAGCAEPGLLRADFLEPASAELKEAVAGANLVVASYVLNELRASRWKTGDFDDLLNETRPGCLVLLLEPGDGKRAIRLMQWRRSFLREHPGWEVVSPCGDRFGQDLPGQCDTCWTCRGEALDPTPLYGEFVRHLPEGATRPLTGDTGERHLSWAYTVLRRRGARDVGPQRAGPDSSPGGASETVVLQVGESSRQGTGGRRVRGKYFGLCPAEVGAPKDAVLWLPADEVPPWLTFGQRVVLRGFDVPPALGNSDEKWWFNWAPGARVEPPENDRPAGPASTVVPYDDAGRKWLEYAFPQPAGTR
ncbi:MAG: hypothetical protein KatS3mg062_0465 [Tepidiforma sp.]|nr:MAG: hypothetical protein KatS3mg062_0465 [Tepidiforma sp.]